MIETPGSRRTVPRASAIGVAPRRSPDLGRLIAVRLLRRVIRLSRVRPPYRDCERVDISHFEVLTLGAIMTAKQSPVTDWLYLVQAEYLEMPGLHLTRPQIRRLWGLEDDTCDALLKQLLATHFLRRTPGDAYVLDDARY